MKLIGSENKKLRTKSDIVKESELKSATKFAKKMLVFLNQHPNGCGLSAVQVGRMKRIFVIRWQGQKVICINPEIISSSKTKESMEEGCLSFPGQSKSIKRPTHVTVKFFNGKHYVEGKISGFIARIFQHEFDHLEGKVCVV